MQSRLVLKMMLALVCIMGIERADFGFSWVLLKRAETPKRSDSTGTKVHTGYGLWRQKHRAK